MYRVIVVIVVVIGALLFAAWNNHSRSEQVQPAPIENFIYQGVPLDAALLHLDKQALNEAYHQHLIKLWLVWLSTGAPEDARQFVSGLRIARRAYTQAAAQISRRETQLLETERRRHLEQPLPERLEK
jgi:hypothetical protein